jgi:beta-galactosidase
MGMLSCSSNNQEDHLRERISLNDNWRFFKYESMAEADELIYDVRPAEDQNYVDSQDADSRPTEALEVVSDDRVLKAWILPTGNKFIKDPASRHLRPGGSPGMDFPFIREDYDDSSWENVSLPHDWGIKGPFLEGWEAEVGGGMGRLASHGVAWYRRNLDIPAGDQGKKIYLDIDGAMSYAMVWINGHLAGGWPYGYNSFRIDLTPYIHFEGDNQLAIRLDNPPKSSRWYPGGGLYRNVWLVKTHAVHVSQWGTFVRTSEVEKESAQIEIEVLLDNHTDSPVEVEVITEVYSLDSDGSQSSRPVGSFPSTEGLIGKGGSTTLKAQTRVRDPLLWGPAPTQEPNLYLAVTKVYLDGEAVDRYETTFGIRALEFDAGKGLMVNGEHIVLKGANQHHDLGALGAAFNTRAAERQIEILKEMGCNAIRMAHNPPAPEYLDLCDRMGILVIDEIFDVWERKKTPLDFHLVFPEWYEADTRSFIRRDRNHPSIIAWSLGNEVGEQYTGEDGAMIARQLQRIAKEEDPTRPTAVAINYARPDMALPPVMDLISLNYQGEGIRNAPAYKHLKGINTPPLYPAFHEKFPDKMIISSENAAAVSSRGEFFFPVRSGISYPVSDTIGSDPQSMQVSSYELYTTPFGSSADKVFRSLEQHPYVAGGFVWSGWDYLGEPTPFYLARSSYFGVIDLAGFRKDRFYLYQSHWRPDHPMVHILPHWNWPDREGKVTPVHVFTSGDEAELYLNGESLGRKQKGEFEYRLRWDDVIYTPGELKVQAFKDGKPWAEEVIRTTGKAAQLEAEVDREMIRADGTDLAFVTLKVIDEQGLVVPTAGMRIRFSIEGPGEIVATDNGNPYCMTAFPSTERAAFNGLALAIVKGKRGESGSFTLRAEAEGLEATEIVIQTNTK